MIKIVNSVLKWLELLILVITLLLVVFKDFISQFLFLQLHEHSVEGGLGGDAMTISYNKL